MSDPRKVYADLLKAQMEAANWRRKYTDLIARIKRMQELRDDLIANRAAIATEVSRES